MEYLRKVGGKSENRKSVIVEAGALAVAANVKHLSLTSKYDIPSPNNVSSYCQEGKGLLIEPMPSPPKRPSHGNTRFQLIWLKSCVLFTLFASFMIIMGNTKQCEYFMTILRERYNVKSKEMWMLRKNNLQVYKNLMNGFYKLFDRKTLKFPINEPLKLRSNWEVQDFSNLLETFSKIRKLDLSDDSKNFFSKFSFQCFNPVWEYIDQHKKCDEDKCKEAQAKIYEYAGIEEGLAHLEEMSEKTHIG